MIAETLSIHIHQVEDIFCVWLDPTGIYLASVSVHPRDDAGDSVPD